MLKTWLTVAEIVYVLLLSGWIVLEKRSPLATLAWILSLAWLPILGFFVYWFMGPQHLRRKRSRRAQAFRRLRASTPTISLLTQGEHLALAKLEPRKRQLMALALNSGAAALTSGNTVQLLTNGSACFPAIEEAIRAARHHIHLEYYIFAGDQTGTRILDLLERKAREGVRVRLLLDAVGSLDLKNKSLARLEAAGGEIGWFNRVSFARFRPKWIFRNHRKIIVCDAQVGFLGGLNIADEYAGVESARGVWRDTHVRVEGPAVRALQLLFLEDWNFATGKSVTQAPYFADAEEKGDEVVQIVGSGPDGGWQTIEQVFFTAITSAQEGVLLSTPYYVPDEAIQTALVSAALRGVDVKVLVPRRGDSRIVTAAGRSYFDELIAAGAKVFEYLPGFLHAKTLTVDGQISLVGSANFDQRSLRLNFEVTGIFYGERVARELEETFENDLTVSREVTAEQRAELSFGDRFGEASARLLSPIL